MIGVRRTAGPFYTLLMRLLPERSGIYGSVTKGTHSHLSPTPLFRSQGSITECKQGCL
jgi:hypothetical protein